MKSSPSSPQIESSPKRASTMRSSPAPPWRRSSPSPPSIVSLPTPPSIASLPFPPLMRSPPAAPRNVSLPPRPSSLSAPPVPVTRSTPALPLSPPAAAVLRPIASTQTKTRVRRGATPRRSCNMREGNSWTGGRNFCSCRHPRAASLAGGPGIRHPMRRPGAIAVLAAICALFACVPAHAKEPVSVRWEKLLPPAGSPVTRQITALPECRRPRLACVDQIIRRQKRLADRYGCDHRAIFARNYQLLTTTLRGYLARPDFFTDRRYLILEAELFDRFYQAAMRPWDRDELKVPGAWRFALEAWRQGDTNGVQDLLLGINAHVQRDMPFVVAAMGLRFADGRSRKPDHDRVNEVLDDAFESIVRMVERDYDPMTAVYASPLTPADDYLGIEMVRSWREGVWRNAERLLSARTKEERAQVAASIETQAEASERTMAAPQPGYGAQRDAYCKSRTQPEK